MAPLLKYLKTYIFDYTVILTLQAYVVFIAIRSQPSLQEFNPFDPKINHTFSTYDTVSDINCLLLATFFPLFIVGLRHIYEYSKDKNSREAGLLGLIQSVFKIENFHKLHTTALGLVYSITITGLIVCVLKNWIGRPRPDFIGRCQPNLSLIGTPTVGKLLYDVSICTGDYETILEGLRSHPSGHSATSFAGMNFLTVWLISQIHYSSRSSPSASSTSLLNNGNIGNSGFVSTFEDLKIGDIRAENIWKLLLLCIPNLIALWVGITRIQDYRHHPSDIIGGCVIGVLVSSIIHWKFFKAGKAIYLNKITDGLPLPLYND